MRQPGLGQVKCTGQQSCSARTHREQQARPHGTGNKNCDSQLHQARAFHCTEAPLLIKPDCTRIAECPIYSSLCSLANTGGFGSVRVDVSWFKKQVFTSFDKFQRILSSPLLNLLPIKNIHRLFTICCENFGSQWVTLEPLSG